MTTALFLADLGISNSTPVNLSAWLFGALPTSQRSRPRKAHGLPRLENAHPGLRASVDLPQG